ncbi:unnamed protein product, partial [marine sediment metagenome]
ETRRNWKKVMVKVGGTYPIQLRMFQPRSECELIKVKYLFNQRLGDMSEEEAKREGGYTLKGFRETFTVINGHWDNDLIVYVIGFKYIDDKK